MIKPIKKTLRLYVGYVQEIIKYPTVKNVRINIPKAVTA